MAEKCSTLAIKLIENGFEKTVASNLELFIESGADPTAVILKFFEEGSELTSQRRKHSVLENLEKFIAAGLEPDVLTDFAIECYDNQYYYWQRDIKDFLKLGADPTAIAMHLVACGNIRDFEYWLPDFILFDAKINVLDIAVKNFNASSRFSFHCVDYFKAGVDPNDFAKEISESKKGKQYVAKNLDQFLKAGLKITYVCENLNQLLENGVQMNYIVGQVLDSVGVVM